MARLTRTQVARLKRLLDMLYKPAEIAQEMGVATDTIYRSFIPAGAPCTRDAKGKVWIPGQAFRDWALNYLGARDAQKKKLNDNEGYCLKCNRVVVMEDAHKSRTVDKARKVGLIQGRCSSCRGKVNRFYQLGAQVEEKNELPAQL